LGKAEHPGWRVLLRGAHPTTEINNKGGGNELALTGRGIGTIRGGEEHLLQQQEIMRRRELTDIFSRRTVVEFPNCY